MALAPSASRPGAAAGRGGSRLGQWNSAVTSYYLLTGATALLLVLGLVMVLSSSAVTSLGQGRSPYAVFLSQAQYALIGLPLLWLASRTPPHVLRKLAWPLLGLAVVGQLLVFTTLGVEWQGNRNWISVAGQSFQPSEAAKLVLAIWLGTLLARKQRLLGQWLHALIPAAPVAALVVGLVLLGRDLGTALVMIVLVAGALFVAGVPTRIFVVAGGLAAMVVWRMVDGNSNRMGRIGAWLSADCDVQAECYQTTHGMWALATGGIWGSGLGASREKWSYLPEASNDYIFAIIGEELGLQGTLLVLGLFGVLAVAMSRVIRRHPDPFVKITTGAIGCWIIGQAFINIAVVIGLLPVIGVPLPFVSAGGSALIMTMVAIGVVMSFARTEPGAAEALAARPGVVRRSLAVVSWGRSARRAAGEAPDG